MKQVRVLIICLLLISVVRGKDVTCKVGKGVGSGGIFSSGDASQCSGWSKITTEVIRVGLFNTVSDGKYLNYNSGTLNELIKSPNEKYTITTSNLFRTSNDKVLFGLDITTGQVISCFSDKEEKNTNFCKRIFIKNMENCDLLCQMEISSNSE